MNKLPAESPIRSYDRPIHLKIIIKPKKPKKPKKHMLLLTVKYGPNFTGRRQAWKIGLMDTNQACINWNQLNHKTHLRMHGELIRQRRIKMQKSDQKNEFHTQNWVKKIEDLMKLKGENPRIVSETIKIKEAAKFNSTRKREGEREWNWLFHWRNFPWKIVKDLNLPA